MISMHSSPVGDLGTRDTGGMSVYVKEVAQRLASRGCSIDIFTRVSHLGGAEIVEPAPGVRVIHLAAGPAEALPQLALYRHLREFFGNLERFRKRERIEYDLVHSHYWLSGLIGRWARKTWKVPHVLMFHTLGALKNRTGGSEKEPELRITLEKQLAGECERILAATAREKRHLMELYGVAPENIQVLPCGVDLELFRPEGRAQSRLRLGLNGNERILLYVGRFDPIKGVDRLLSATAELRRRVPVRLILVGGGGDDSAEVQGLHTRGSESALEDGVIFAGRRSHADLPDYYRAADVLVLPSHYESFGLVVLEALACGTPVVAPRVGVVEDVIRNGVNGRVVPDNAPESLAAGVLEVLQWHRRDRDRRVAADVIRATAANYDWSIVAAAVEREYRVLLGVEDGFADAGSALACSTCR